MPLVDRHVLCRPLSAFLVFLSPSISWWDYLGQLPTCEQFCISAVIRAVSRRGSCKAACPSLVNSTHATCSRPVIRWTFYYNIVVPFWETPSSHYAVLVLRALREAPTFGFRSQRPVEWLYTFPINFFATETFLGRTDISKAIDKHKIAFYYVLSYSSKFFSTVIAER